MRVDILVIEISDLVLSKINSKHGITADDVQHACDQYEAASWRRDPGRGERLFVRGAAENGDVLRVILYPVAGFPGYFRLGTAFR